MKCPEETRQKIWELLYDLLPADEADALRAQITSDPAVARAYSEARLRADLLAAAAKREEPKLPLDVPGASDKFDLDNTETSPAERASLAHVVSILATLAALLLVAFAGFGYARYGAPWEAAAASLQREELAENHVKVVVAGPSEIDPSVDNTISVNTWGIDGVPISAEVDVRLLAASGEVSYEDHQRTDENGRANFALPGKSVSELASLQVEVAADQRTEKLAANLASAPESVKDEKEDKSLKWYVARNLESSRRSVELDVRAANMGNLVVTAQNGGKQIGQQTVAAAAEPMVQEFQEGKGASKDARHFSLDLPDNVSGPTRVILFDGTTPVVEQFFYIQSPQKLSILRADPVDVYSPGADAQLQFQVSAEGGGPVPADLRVAVVEQEALTAGERVSGARDNWLEVASVTRNKVDSPSDADQETQVVSDIAAPPVPPLVLDNTSQVESEYAHALADFDSRREARLRLVGQIVLASGGTLFVALTVLALLRLAGRARTLIPAFAMSALCALVGGVWSTARVNERGELATVASFSNWRAASDSVERQVAKNDLDPKPNAPATVRSDKDVAESFSESGTQRATGDEPASLEPAPVLPSDPSATVLAPAPAQTAAPGELDSSKEFSKQPAPTKPASGDRPGGNIAGGPRVPEGPKAIGGSGGVGKGSGFGGGGGAGAGGFAPGGLGGGRLGGDVGGSGAMSYWRSSSRGGGGYGGAANEFGFAPNAQLDDQSVPTVYSNGLLAAGDDGRSTVTFKLPSKPGVYHVFVEGRSGQRLGTYRGKLTVREAPATEASEKPTEKE